MNPTISEDLIRRELEKDPESARAEWLGQFREDLEAAFSLEQTEACIIRGQHEMPASKSISYRAFCDPSGDKKDSFTLAIGYKTALQKPLLIISAHGKRRLIPRQWFRDPSPLRLRQRYGRQLRGRMASRYVSKSWHRLRTER
jgi:hypothetical protein